MSPARLIACVLLPFTAGYFLSYLFRTINAVIAGDLTTELDLGPADLGLLTSAYFLFFAAAQLPVGAMLDRLGPALVQGTLMLFASVGALVFALSDDIIGLLIGRSLIGLGIAAALMAGIKAITTWFPGDRQALAVGTLMMLGGLGALVSTGPAELIVQAIGWRNLFLVLACLSTCAALLVLLVAPAWRTPPPARNPANYDTIYGNARFWRVAPLCALGIGTSWSLQGLWAAPWLRDVEHLDRAAVAQHLTVMALSLSAGALLLGYLVDRLRRAGVKTEVLLIATLGLSMIAQAALILRWPVPPMLPWAIISATSAATVLSYALMSDYFPKAISGRANGALNLLHLSGAFLLQSTTGFTIEQWPATAGSYPASAYQIALAIPLVLQLAALAWLLLSQLIPSAAEPATDKRTSTARSSSRPAFAHPSPRMPATARAPAARRERSAQTRKAVP